MSRMKEITSRWNGIRKKTHVTVRPPLLVNYNIMYLLKVAGNKLVTHMAAISQNPCRYHAFINIFRKYGTNPARSWSISIKRANWSCDTSCPRHELRLSVVIFRVIHYMRKLPRPSFFIHNVHVKTLQFDKLLKKSFDAHAKTP